jgi:hypothetical protein
MATATCAFEIVALQIVYSSETDKALGFQQVQPNPSVTFNQINVPNPRVNMPSFKGTGRTPLPTHGASK